MATRASARPAYDGQLSADGALAALRHAADGVRRVGELAGHATAAAELLERLAHSKAHAGPDAARALRTAWVSAAGRARAAYETTTGQLRSLENLTAPAASQQLMRAFEALDHLSVGYLDEEEGAAR